MLLYKNGDAQKLASPQADNKPKLLRPVQLAHHAALKIEMRKRKNGIATSRQEASLGKKT